MQGSLFHTASFAALLALASATAFAQPVVIAPGGVLNGASFDKTGQPIAPGALVSIFGTDLSAATASASSVPISTSLSSVTVTFNGVSAAVKDVVHSSANGDQLNVQVPWEILPLVPPGTSASTQ